MNDIFFTELICIDYDITNALILNKKYYGIDADATIFSGKKYIHIYNDNFDYIAPFRKDKFITVKNFRNKRLNNILNVY